MPETVRDRFLIALAKFLGENPTQPKPLADVLVCEEWHFDETLKSILTTDHRLTLDREKLNRVLLNCGRKKTTDHFCEYFFSKVATIEQFEAAVERFRIKAMWLYGNFRFAYKMLATSNQESFSELIAKTEQIDQEIFAQRNDFIEIEQIPADDLDLLGYVSGQEVSDLGMAQDVLSTLEQNFSKTVELLERVGPATQEKVATVLKKHDLTFPQSGTEGFTEGRVRELLKAVTEKYSNLKQRRERAVEIGKRNTQRYLTLPNLDVYVATSMRKKPEFLAHHSFIQSVFTNPLVSSLKLRFFDPTLSYVDDRITKGLIEMLMLRRANVTIYSAGVEDTLGKDSELASTLAQGKAVIVYVPSEPKVVKLEDGRTVDLDRRASTFKIDHPLGLQIDVRTGVAHGIIVVRSAEECARMLRKVMLHERSFTIRHEKGVHLLEETETGSILRVVSDDPLLTHSFWVHFPDQSSEPT